MFECPDCNKRFYSVSACQQHQTSKKHCYCRYCDKVYLKTQDLQIHDCALHQWPCLECGSKFSTNAGRSMHQKSKRHHDCSACNQYFSSHQAMEKHHAAVHYHLCPECSQVFCTLEGKLTHQNTDHAFCEECDRFFVNPQALQQHLRSQLHASQFHCCDCGKDFNSEGDLNQHIRYKTHRRHRSSGRSSDASTEYDCRQCDASFTDRIALKQHEASRAHNPLCNISCVASKRCKKIFTSPSALVHHLESGSCRSGVNREIVNKACVSSDQDHFITDALAHDMSELSIDLQHPRFLSPSASNDGILTPNTEDSRKLAPNIVNEGTRDTRSSLSQPQSPSDFGSVQLTPQSTGSQLTDVIPLLSQLRCPLCPSTRRPFCRLQALRDHMASPAHAPKNFHCPPPSADNVDDLSYVKKLSTLSGLVQHLESGLCVDGMESLLKVVGHMEQKLQLKGFRGVRLMP